jgi:hypothetical protein
VPAGPANEEGARECDWCQDSSRPKLYRNRIPERTEWVCRKCLEERSKAPEPSPLVDRVLASDEPEPEACSCDESEGLKRQIEVVRIQAQLGVGPHVNPRCPGEAACREILLITSP